MTDSAPPEDASPPDSVARPAASRWAKLWGLLNRFRWPIAVAGVVLLTLIALALIQLPTVWQTIVTIASVGAVLSGLVGYWSTYHAVRKSVPLSASTKGPVAASALSIVVLPFQNLTGDARQAYVADGLTASLTADLYRIRDAFIVNAATAFAYRDKPLTAQQVGNDLGVHFVLHGSVQRSGTKIRVNAQLADSTSNAQLWSESFEGDETDLFALQDQVTTLVGNSIGREMVIVAAHESETRKTSPKVADLMLRARALGLKPASLKTRQQMEDLYRQALAQEPNNSNAMAALALTLVLQVDNFPSKMDEDVKEKKMVEGRDFALRAKELDPDNPAIPVVIGAYALHHGDLTGARRASEILLSLRPKDPSAYVNLAYTFVREGKPRRAIELLTQAFHLDPKHSHEFVSHLSGLAYLMLGDNDAAIEWFMKALERNPSFAATYALLAMAYANQAEDLKARAAVAEARRLDPNIKLSTFDGKRASSPVYKEWFESKLVPAWRKAGLPE
jgi:adenylate cyclase